MASRARVAAGLVLLGAALAPRPALADFWYLTDVAFDDGGTATGWVETTGSACPTNWRIDVAGGNETDFPSIRYAGATGSCSYAGLVLFLNQPLSTRQLRLTPIAALTGSGPIALDLANPNFAVECFNCGGLFRLISSGSFALPEPEGAAGAALLSLGWLAAIRRGSTRRA
jgi:hypothetical protein